MRKNFIYILLCLLSLFRPTLYGWWDEGHMAIAKIAYDRLTPAAREEATRLIAIFSPFFPDSTTFITSACWPDDISDRGIRGFSSWHHSSLPYDPDAFLTASETEKAIALLVGKDTIYALNECMNTLQNPESIDWAKGLMLRFFIHFVGDLHQPLHCASLYNGQFPRGDWGGNLFNIVWHGHRKANLHAFWDSICGLGEKKLPRPLNKQDQVSIDTLANHICTQFPESAFSEQALNDEDFCHWREEGYHIAITQAYQGICIGQAPSKDYITKGQETASSRIALAGYRLARLLNKILNAS